jgi:hypothetical protein
MIDNTLEDRGRWSRRKTTPKIWLEDGYLYVQKDTRNSIGNGWSMSDLYRVKLEKIERVLKRLEPVPTLAGA